MTPLSIAEIAAVAGGTVAGDAIVTVTAPAVLDGRQAGRAGAVAVLSSRPTPLPTVVAADTQAALQALAAHVVARLRHD